jgi:Glycine-zipper domain
MTGTRSDQPRVGAWRDARRQTLSVGLVSLVLAAVLLPSPGSAQWSRRGALVGREGYGRGLEERYGAPGGGYSYQAGLAPAYGGYPPAGYAAPAPGYGPSGYGPPGGYPPQGYAPPAYAQPYAQPYAYPPAGQNPQQAGASQMQCQSWASTQSGYNPSAPSTSGTETTGQRAMAGGRSLVRGGARGAAAGAIGGAIGGDAGKGAEMGAAMGGLVGGFRRRDERRAQMQEQNQALQQQSQQSASYSRALEACLTGQGYTVR